IGSEAAGNPFLLIELLRLHLERPLEPIPTVATVVRRRMSLLGVDEVALLELAAIAPGPLDVELLHATLWADARTHALDSAGLRRLCGLKILRELGTRGRPPGPSCERYDFYHHRIREAIKAELPAERSQRLHRRLAATLAQLRPDDAESLVRELVLGGEEVQA